MIENVTTSAAKEVRAEGQPVQIERSAVGVVRGKDVEIGTAVAGLVIADGDVSVTQGGGRALVAGGDLRIHQGGGGTLIAAGDASISQGGAGSLLGPILGAVVYYRVDQISRDLPEKTWLPDAIQDFLQGRPNLATLVFAALLILLMFVAPFGLVGFAKRIGRRLVVVVPAIPTSRPVAPIAEPEAVAST